jgi:hypothetical protein
MGCIVIPIVIPKEPFRMTKHLFANVNTVYSHLQKDAKKEP